MLAHGGSFVIAPIYHMSTSILYAFHCLVTCILFSPLYYARSQYQTAQIVNTLLRLLQLSRKHAYLLFSRYHFVRVQSTRAFLIMLFALLCNMRLLNTFPLLLVFLIIK